MDGIGEEKVLQVAIDLEDELMIAAAKQGGALWFPVRGGAGGLAHQPVLADLLDEGDDGGIAAGRVAGKRG